MRSEAIDFLVALLNADAVPALPATDVAAAVAQLLSGSLAPTAGLAAAPGLSAYEQTVLLQLTAPAAAAALVAVLGVQLAVQAGDANTALAVETVRASTKPYQAEANEQVRNLPGQVASSLTIRTLLEGSRELLAAGAAGAATTDAALATAHQLHGAASAPLANATRLLQLEVNSAPAAPEAPVQEKKGGAKGGAAAAGAAAGAGGAAASAAGLPTPTAFHAQALIVSTQQAEESVAVLTAATVGRLHALLSSLKEAAAFTAANAAEVLAAAGINVESAAAKQALAALGAPAPVSVTPASAAAVTIEAATAQQTAGLAAAALQIRTDALILLQGMEAALAVTELRKREAAAVKEAAAKEAKKAAALAAREEAEAARLAAMAPEQRAKAEEEAAKKKEKAAKKEAAEAAAAGGAGAAAAGSSAGASAGPANLLGLGAGTNGLFHFIKAAGNAAGSAAAPAEQPVAEVLSAALQALSPYAPAAATLTAGGAGASSTAAGSAANAAGTLLRVDAFLRATIEKINMGGAGVGKRKPKIPKGARDYMPAQMEVREKAFNTIREVFKRHGAAEIDTPVFELKETLLGKYGEEGGKLIYDLADQGGELLSLRYDLTVPFARFLALHGIESIKRYHIARVYRRDNPAMNRGRFREFYQCDFDIAGTYASMMPDAEVLAVAVEILSSLPIGEFTIKLNHRGLLDAMMEICGIPSSKFRPVCSAIDKLDKEPWAAVRAELIEQKGIAPAVVDRIGTYVQISGEPKALLQRLSTDAALFTSHSGAVAVLKELGTLFGYLDAMGVLHRITFDLSLARGLDYYTGVIYEAVLLDPSIGVGSIAAGGRYDNLVGMFGSTVVPCVGVSIGVERVFAIMEARAASEGGLTRTPISVLVAAIPSARYDMNTERMKVLRQLWSAGLSAEMVFSSDPKLQKQVTAAAEGNVPVMVVLGEDELDKGLVQLKDMQKRTADNVSREALVAEVLKRGVLRVGAALTLASATSAAAVEGGAAGVGAAAASTAAPAAGGAAAGGAGAAAATASSVSAIYASSPITGIVASPGAGKGSADLVMEGGDRLYGRFARPLNI